MGEVEGGELEGVRERGRRARVDVCCAMVSLHCVETRWMACVTIARIHSARSDINSLGRHRRCR